MRTDYIASIDKINRPVPAHTSSHTYTQTTKLALELFVYSDLYLIKNTHFTVCDPA